MERAPIKFHYSYEEIIAFKFAIIANVLLAMRDICLEILDQGILWKYKETCKPISQISDMVRCHADVIYNQTLHNLVVELMKDSVWLQYFKTYRYSRGVFYGFD